MAVSTRLRRSLSLSILLVLVTRATPVMALDTKAYFKPTECAGENDVWEAEAKSDGDIRIVAEPNLRVMFHGNRFVVAYELAKAFERAFPEARVSYTAIPPVHTHDRLAGKTPQIAALDAFGMPDIVMLPGNSLLMGHESEQLYSRVRGMVLIARADDARVSGLAAPVEHPDLKMVFQGMQNRLLHATYTVPRSYYGATQFDSWTGSSRAGFSQLKHHRSVPARILLGCEDVGFQYKQSQAFLEQAKPGRFKFFDIPAAPELLKTEASYLYVLTPTSVLAKRFAEYMVGPEAQGILAKYSLQK